MWTALKSLGFLIAASASLAALAPAVAQDSAPTVETPEIKPGLEKIYAKAVRKEAKGLANLVLADRDAEAARTDVTEGERIFAAAKATLENQQQAYRGNVDRMGTATSAKEIIAEAKALESIAKMWGEAEASMSKGAKIIKNANNDLSDAMKRQAKAEQRIVDGRAGIARAVIEPASDAVSSASASEAIDVVPVNDMN